MNAEDCTICHKRNRGKIRRIGCGLGLKTAGINSAADNSKSRPGHPTQIFGDERLTLALLDRLTHKAHIIEFTDELGALWVRPPFMP